MVATVLNLPAQMILSESDLKERRDFYKSEFEKKSFRYKQYSTMTTGQSYDVVYYQLEFNIGIDPNSFSAKATEKYVSLVDNLDEIDLDFDSYLTVDGVSGDANTHESNGYTLNLGLTRTYNMGDTIEVVIDYHGIPRTEGDYVGLWFGIHREGPGDPIAPVVYTMSEPYGARSWWPCKDDPMDKPDSMDIIITIPDNTYNGNKLYAVSNGSLISRVENDNGTETFHWQEKYPIATYLVSLAISNYQISSDWFVYTDNDSMPVIYYVYPEKMDRALVSYDSTLDMIKTYSDYFTLYPFIEEKYGMANFGWVGAMENQTVASMGLMGFWIVAHELAHQWFGNLITCSDFHHIWLNEGWATYLEAIYSEKLYESDGYHNYMNAISYYGVGKSIYIEDPFQDNIFDTIVYDKGAWILHMLRKIMGDSQFFVAVKNYLNSPQLKYKSATTSDFQLIMEQSYGSSLDWFFQQWIYGMGYPIYNYNWTYEQVEDRFIISLILEQVQAVSGSEEVFTMPLDVVLEQSSGVDQDTIQIWNNKRIQSFEIISDLEPSAIKLDPLNWVLKKSEEVTPIVNTSKINSFKYELEQNYPNPFNPTTMINYQLRMTNDVDLSIYNVLGQKVVTLVSDRQKSGYYQIDWDASIYPSGIYYYVINSGTYREVKKMILLK